MRYIASSGERKVTIEVEDNGHRRHTLLDETAYEVEWQAVGGAVLRATPGAMAGHYSLLVGDRSYDVYIHPVPAPAAGASGGEQVFAVEIEGQPYHIRLEDERTRKLAGLAEAAHEHGEAAVMAPMPGLVSNVMVEVGQEVTRGQTVVVLEAMKMENDLGAPRAGVVRSLLVSKGQTVNQAQVLAIIGDPKGAAPEHEHADEDEDEEVRA